MDIGHKSMKIEKVEDRATNYKICISWNILIEVMKLIKIYCIIFAERQYLMPLVQISVQLYILFCKNGVKCYPYGHTLFEIAGA